MLELQTLFIFYRLRAIWPKGCQRGSLATVKRSGSVDQHWQTSKDLALASKRQKITTKLLLTLFMLLNAVL